MTCSPLAPSTDPPSVGAEVTATACASPPAAASPRPRVTAQVSAESSTPAAAPPVPSLRRHARAQVEFADSLADLPEKFAVMIAQDSGFYRCGDYLLLAEIEKAEAQARAQAEAQGGRVQADAQVQAQARADAESEAALWAESPSGAADFPRDLRRRRPIQPEWREKMAQWSYQVVDHYGYDREVVAASMSHLDRYISAYGGAIDTRLFKLLAVATLFLSLKLQPGSSPDGSRPECGIPAKTLADLSLGIFDKNRVIEAEMAILVGLGWRVHPPTSAAFLRRLVLLLPLRHEWARHNVQEKATFLVELSVLDGVFVPKRRSSIALAALLEALEEGAAGLSDEAESVFYESVRSIAGLDPDDGEVAECRERLRGVIDANGYGQ